LNSTKIHDQLGWKIKTAFDDGLKKTVQWYLDNPELLNNISSTALDPTPWKSSN
jgi:dTDP-glucose 4,6-dehydratase